MQSAPLRELTRQEIADYREHGVVCLRQVISQEWLDYVGDEFDFIMANLRRSPNHINASEAAKALTRMGLPTLAQAGSPGDRRKIGSLESSLIGILPRASLNKTMARIAQWLPPRNSESVKANARFLIDTYSSTRSEKIMHFALHSPLAELAAQLVGSSKINFLGDQLFLKEPDCIHRTAFHQDESYYNCTGEQLCSIWVPLDLVTLANGTMGYVRGSHKNGKHYKPNFFVSQAALPDSLGDDIPDIEGNEDQFDIMYYEAQLGDVIVHHCRTLHGSRANQSSTRRRRAASMRYFGEDVRYYHRPGAPTHENYSHSLENGDRMDDCPDFPRAWPR